jgi:hypothetical protein
MEKLEEISTQAVLSDDLKDMKAYAFKGTEDTVYEEGMDGEYNCAMSTCHCATW